MENANVNTAPATAVKKERDSNFELLRIVAMLLIVAHHYVVHAGFSFDNSLSFNKILIQVLSSGGKLAVNCFVLITGWFLSTQKVKFKSVFMFIVQVTCFSIAIDLFTYLLGYTSLTKTGLLKTVFPLIFNGWWFASAYFMLMVLAPFLNVLIKNLTHNQHLTLVIALCVLWSIIPTLFNVYMESNNLLWFCFLYLIAAYAKKYELKTFSNMKVAFITFIFATLFIVLSILALDVLGTKKEFYSLQATWFASMQAFPCLVQSVALFFIFKNLKIKNSKLINTVAGAMFGVYLLHDRLKYVIWYKILDNASYQSSNFLIVHAIISIALVFVACTLISLLYNFTVKKLALKCYDKLEPKVSKYFKPIKQRFTRTEDTVE